jgi:hypothetical protein
MPFLNSAAWWRMHSGQCESFAWNRATHDLTNTLCKSLSWVCSRQCTFGLRFDSPILEFRLSSPMMVSMCSAKPTSPVDHVLGPTSGVASWSWLISTVLLAALDLHMSMQWMCAPLLKRYSKLSTKQSVRRSSPSTFWLVTGAFYI